jgi:hypothetical protein
MLSEIVWNEKTLAIVMGCLIPIVAILGGVWYSIQKVKSDNLLKRKMVERGMSAEEMEKILAMPASKDE